MPEYRIEFAQQMAIEGPHWVLFSRTCREAVFTFLVTHFGTGVIKEGKACMGREKKAELRDMEEYEWNVHGPKIACTCGRNRAPLDSDGSEAGKKNGNPNCEN